MIATAARRTLARFRADRRLRAACFGLVVVPALWIRSPHVPYYDFCTYYTAGLLASEGDPASAFDPGRLRARHAELHPGPRGVGPFYYSPLWLAPARALVARPFGEAELLHRGVSAVALGLGLALLLTRVERASLQALVAGAFVLAHPAWVQLAYENWSLWLLPLLAGAALAASNGRDGAAGLCWALALHLKVFLALALVALWVAGRRRVAVAALVLAAILAAGSLPWTGSESWQRWASLLRHAEAGGVNPFYNKVSIAANVARLSTEPRDWIRPRAPVGGVVVRGLFWAALPLLGLALYRLRDDPEAAVALTLGWTLLFVPQIWDHTELLLFLVLPALTSRRLVWIAGLLAATAFYNGLLQPQLVAAARGAVSATPVRLLIWLFPVINVAACAAVLASSAERRARRVAAD